MRDSIICENKKDSFEMIDLLKGENIHDFEFLEEGKVQLMLSCTFKEMFERAYNKGYTEALKWASEEIRRH